MGCSFMVGGLRTVLSSFMMVDVDPWGHPLPECVTDLMVISPGGGSVARARAGRSRRLERNFIVTISCAAGSRVSTLKYVEMHRFCGTSRQCKWGRMLEDVVEINTKESGEQGPHLYTPGPQEKRLFRGRSPRQSNGNYIARVLTLEHGKREGHFGVG